MHSQIQFEEGEAKQRLTQSTSPSPIQASSCSTVCHGQWLHKKPFFSFVSVFLWHWHLPDPALCSPKSSNDSHRGISRSFAKPCHWIQLIRRDVFAEIGINTNLCVASSCFQCDLEL